jgi:hypothetical protein
MREEHEGFKKLQGDLERKGNGPEDAAKIAASIGDKKYGKEDMEKASREGRPADKVDDKKPCSNGIPCAPGDIKWDQGQTQVSEDAVNRLALQMFMTQGFRR